MHLESGVSFVLSAEIANLVVSCGVKDQPVERVVAAIARSAGVRVSWHTPTMAYVGELSPEDEAVMFRRVRRGSVADLRALAAVVQTREGRVFVSEDGLLVASDVLASVQKLESVLTELESVAVPVWMVEVFGVQSRASFERRLSLKVAPTARIGAAIANGDVLASFSRAAFEAYLEAVDTARDSELELHPMLLVPDGKSSRVGVSSQRFVVRRNQTPEGGSVVDGFDRLEAGTIVQVSVREQTADNAEIDLSLDVTSFVTGDELPGVEGLRLEMPLVVRSGVPYLVGTFDDVDTTNEKPTWLSWGRAAIQRESKMAVWVRATRIDLSTASPGASVERRGSRANEAGMIEVGLSEES